MGSYSHSNSWIPETPETKKQTGHIKSVNTNLTDWGCGVLGQHLLFFSHPLGPPDILVEEKVEPFEGDKWAGGHRDVLFLATSL